MVKIAASLLAADAANLAAEARAMEAAGADWLHLDVMDGHFVRNLSFGPGVCAALRPHVRGVLDVHLMVTEASAHLEAFGKAGADRIALHLESGGNVGRSLQAIRGMGCKAGLAVNPGSGLAAVEALLDEVDQIVLLTVNPGIGGQRMLPGQVERVRRVKAMIAGRNIVLEVDGGVSFENAGALAAAGADVLVMGGGLFAGGAAAYAGNVGALRRAALQA